MWRCLILDGKVLQCVFCWFVLKSLNSFTDGLLECWWTAPKPAGTVARWHHNPLSHLFLCSVHLHCYDYPDQGRSHSCRKLYSQALLLHSHRYLGKKACMACCRGTIIFSVLSWLRLTNVYCVYNLSIAWKLFECDKLKLMCLQTSHWWNQMASWACLGCARPSPSKEMTVRSRLQGICASAPLTGELELICLMHQRCMMFFTSISILNNSFNIY